MVTLDKNFKVQLHTQVRPGLEELLTTSEDIVDTFWNILVLKRASLPKQ